MCNIFGAISMTLDFIQRVVTFGLICILCGIVCIGMMLAIAAGVAYGYNYSMAEWLTFKKYDVTVFMRRGQFYENPDIDVDKELYARRSNEGTDTFGNSSEETPLPESLGKGNLPDTWKNLLDAKKYAEQLRRYFPRPDQRMTVAFRSEDTTNDKEAFANFAERILDKIPSEYPPIKPIRTTLTTLYNNMAPKTTWVHLRNFIPLQDTTKTSRGPPVTDKNVVLEDFVELDENSSIDYEEREDTGVDDQKKIMKVERRLTRTPLKVLLKDVDKSEQSEESDEDNVIYKPV